MLPLGPLSVPTIIGRERELAAIHDTLKAGHGTLLVAGEAGIGKSRLMRETRVLAAASGYGLCQGVCYDRDLTLPFAPFLEMMRDFASRQPALVRQYLAQTAPHFSRFVPELAPPAGPQTRHSSPNRSGAGSSMK